MGFQLTVHGASSRCYGSPSDPIEPLCVQVCVIRAPSFAGWALGLCKRGFLDAATTEKITLDTMDDPAPTLRTLLPPATAAELPEELGGARR